MEDKMDAIEALNYIIGVSVGIVGVIFVLAFMIWIFWSSWRP